MYDLRPQGIAGSKRSSSGQVLHHPPDSGGTAHRADTGYCDHLLEHGCIDPRKLQCDTCAASQPAFRSAKRHQTAAHASYPCALHLPEQNDCSLASTPVDGSGACDGVIVSGDDCAGACTTPCFGDLSCNADYACDDPNCEGEPCFEQECADSECTKTSCPDNQCMTQTCDAEPCVPPPDTCNFAHLPSTWHDLALSLEPQGHQHGSLLQHGPVSFSSSDNLDFSAHFSESNQHLTDHVNPYSRSQQYAGRDTQSFSSQTPHGFLDQYATQSSTFGDHVYNICSISPNSCCHGCLPVCSQGCANYGISTPGTGERALGMSFSYASHGQDTILSDSAASLEQHHGLYSIDSNVASISADQQDVYGAASVLSAALPLSAASNMQIQSQAVSTRANHYPGYNNQDGLLTLLQYGFRSSLEGARPATTSSSNAHQSSATTPTLTNSQDATPPSSISPVGSPRQEPCLALHTKAYGQAEKLPRFAVKEEAEPGPENDSSPFMCKWNVASHPEVEKSPCSHICTSAEDLHNHIKEKHTEKLKEQKKFVCRWINCTNTKDFDQCSKLNRHMQTHANHKPHLCNYPGCGKAFITAQTRDNHQRTHDNQKPFKCQFCDFWATTKTQINTHENAIHIQDKKFRCKYCAFSCTDSSNLSKHEKIHREKTFTCPHPGCAFKPDCRWENVKRHFQTSGHCPELLSDLAKQKAYKEAAMAAAAKAKVGKRSTGGKAINGNAASAAEEVIPKQEALPGTP